MALVLSHRLPLPLPLLLVFLFAASRGAPSSGDDSYNSSMCMQSYRCGNTNISYPFYLYNEAAVLLEKEGYYCGYPGLGIQCKDDHTAVLLGNYTVLSINYTDYTVTVADQEVFKGGSCPRVDRNVTIPQNTSLSYPNTAVDYLLFFLNCSPDLVRSINISPIRCDTFGGGMEARLSFVLPRNEELPRELFWACQPIIEVPVLQLSDVAWNDSRWINGGYGADLRRGFQLEWDQKKPPQCIQCEQSRGSCAYNQVGVFKGCLCSDGRVKALNCTIDSSGSSKYLEA